MSGPAHRSRRWRRQLRALVLAWAALLALMLLSLGAAYLPVGAGIRAAAGLGIACVKAGIVAVVFMQLGRGHALVRVVVAVGLALLLVMGTLSAVDYATRRVQPAALQLPQRSDIPDPPRP
jgi:cytochrome c oxidase subunit IV